MIATCGWLKRNILLFKQQPWCLSLSPSLPLHGCMCIWFAHLQNYLSDEELVVQLCWNYIWILSTKSVPTLLLFKNQSNQRNNQIRRLLFDLKQFVVHLLYDTFPFTIPIKSCIFVHKFHHSQHQPQINRSNIISTWNTNCNNLNFDNILSSNEVLLLLISDCVTGKSVI